MFVDSPADITVDARAVQNKSDVPVECIVTSPSGKKTEAFVQPVGDGTYKVEYSGNI